MRTLPLCPKLCHLAPNSATLPRTLPLCPKLCHFALNAATLLQAETWLERRMVFTRSLAVMSMVGSVVDLTLHRTPLRLCCGQVMGLAVV
jgi:hypothetical protein